MQCLNRDVQLARYAENFNSAETALRVFQLVVGGDELLRRERSFL